jgi:hypothetical protein
MSMPEKLCEECGLPIAACNALAMYRKAVQYYKLGRAEEANRYVTCAEEDYERYLASGRLQRSD